MKNLFKGLLSVVVALAMVITVMPTVEVSAADGIDTEEELRQAIEDANGTDSVTITLGGNITLSTPLIINKSNIVLDLNEKEITAATGFVTAPASNPHLVHIGNDGGSTNETKNITIKNGKLIATDVNKHALNIYCSENVIIEDMEIIHNGTLQYGVPIVVNTSSVTVKGDLDLKATGPKAYHGIDVSNKYDNTTSLDISTNANVSVDVPYDWAVTTSGTVSFSEEDAVKLGAIAKVGGNYTQSLQAAVNLVPDATETTISLLTSASGDGVKVPSNKNIIFDFDGNTYTVNGKLVGSSGTESQAMQLLENSKVTLLDGKLESTNARMLVQNYSDLTVENFTLDGTGMPGTYVLSNNNGDTVITGESHIIASENQVAFDVYHDGVYYENVTVTFDNNFTGSVVGEIEYDTVDTTDAALNINTGDFSKATLSVNVPTSSEPSIDVSGGIITSELEHYLSANTGVTENGQVFTKVSTESELETAIANGGVLQLMDDIQITNKIDINKPVTINGNDQYKIWANNSKNIFYISADTTFNDVIIENSTREGRCINTRKDNITVNVNSSQLKATGSGNTQPITVGTSNNITLNVTDSIVDAGQNGYALISFVKGDLNINNSELKGYSAIYLRNDSSNSTASNSTVDIINSSVSYSENIHSGVSNAFATIVLQNVDNVSLNIKDSEVSAKQTGDQPQSIIIIQESSEALQEIRNNRITITGKSKINLVGEGVFINSASTIAELEEQVTVADSVSVSSNLRSEVSRFVPEEPKSTVEFVVDGKVWRTYRVTKGADIRMPEVPEKEGYVGEWNHDGENIRTATTITAVYTKVEEPVNNTDLSDYADFQLPVYANSRVTNIATANGSITVDGYMFKANANLDNENSIWREIIFVNEEDYSMAKAYRKQVTPVYNTWLNKNMTATGNGTYKLDYANYTVTFSNTDINNYVGNTAATRMATGSYLAYMRISDGTDSYLFPLKDIVLSDGSTLALPSGFEVVDGTTRALRYIVK